MKVKEAYEHLKVLVEQGNEDIILMSYDTRSGDTNEVNIYPDTKEVTGDEEAGEILEMEPGTKYVPVYIG